VCPSRSRHSSTMLQVCLVGTGRMGQLRAPILYANPRAELSYVVDVVEEAAGQLAAVYQCASASSLTTAITNAKAAGKPLQAVWITTPTSSHGAIIREAAAAGLAVFTEKPVSEEPEDIRGLFEVCHNAGVPLMCGFQRRFDPSYIAMKEKVARGDVGKVHFIRVFFGDHPVPPIEFLKAGGCPFMDLSPHDLDFARWLLDGDVPTKVYGTGSSSTPELAEAAVLDNAMLMVQFSAGAICTVSMSRGRRRRRRHEVSDPFASRRMAVPVVIGASAAPLAWSGLCVVGSGSRGRRMSWVVALNSQSTAAVRRWGCPCGKGSTSLEWDMLCRVLGS